MYCCWTSSTANYFIIEWGIYPILSAGYGEGIILFILFVQIWGDCPKT